MSQQYILGLEKKLNNPRSGYVVVGNIGQTGFLSLQCTGGVLSAVKNNGYTERDAIITISFEDQGYVPQILISIQNPILSSTTNDLFSHTIQAVGQSSATIYLEKNNSGDNMGIILHIAILQTLK